MTRARGPIAGDDFRSVSGGFSLASEPRLPMEQCVAWRAGAAVLLALAVVLRSPWMLIMCAILTSAGVVSWAWSRASLGGLRFERRLSVARAEVGDSVEVALSVFNGKLLPLASLRLTDSVPHRLEFAGPELAHAASAEQRHLVQVVALGPYERVTWRYQANCMRRGHYYFGPIRMDAGDPFGIYHVRGVHAAHQRLVVVPRVRSLTELGLPPTDPFGARRSPRSLVHDPLRPIAVRDHQPEDDRRLVHWKATARLGKLKVKVLEPVSRPEIVIVLNGSTFPSAWIGVDPDLQEAAVTVAASIAADAAAKGHAVGLVSNAVMPGAGRPIRVAPGRGSDSLAHILEALAALGPFVDVPVERMLATEAKRAPWGAALIVVTVVVQDGLESALYRLRLAGRRVALVSLDATYDRALPGVPTYRISPDEVRYAPGRTS